MPDAMRQDHDDCRKVLNLPLRHLTDDDVEILTRVHNAHFSRSNIGWMELRMARVLCDRLLRGA